MGMCKGCSEVDSALNMKYGYCKKCLSSKDEETIKLYQKWEEESSTKDKSDTPLKCIFIGVIFSIIFLIALFSLIAGSSVSTTSHWGWVINEPFMQWVILILSGFAMKHYFSSSHHFPC